MKSIELVQVKAMLREIVATSGNNGGDVKAVMALGEPADNVQPEIMNLGEFNDVLRTVQKAIPSMRAGIVMLNEAEWKRLEQLYHYRVIKPLFD